MGCGNYAKAAVTCGECVRGFDFTFVELYFLGYRSLASIFSHAEFGFETYVSYDSQTIGTNLRLGFALTEEIAFQPRYSFY